MKLLIESRVYLPYKEGNFKATREEKLILASSKTKFCCETLKEFITDELSSSYFIAFREDSGKLVLTYHWHECERVISFCPFCGEAITGEVFSRKTLKRVNKKVLTNDWEYQEVKTKSGRHA